MEVSTGDYKEVSGRLKYALDTKGTALLTGRSGTGKKYALKKFVESLNPCLYKAVYMPMSTLNIIEFYRDLSR